MERLAPTWEVSLVVGHVDHGLRAQSREEAELVRALALARGLRFYGHRLTLDPGAGLPARARAARRAALLEQAQQANARFIALGHTATDQSETVLMHLVRGAGLKGLGGMQPFDPPWMRPLLRLTRAETRALADRLAIPYVDDPTNILRTHLRVRMREDVLARLRDENSNVEQAIVSAARLVRDAEFALEAVVMQEEQRRRKSDALGSDGRSPVASTREARQRMAWDVDGLGALPRAVRTRLVRRIAQVAGVDDECLGHLVVDTIDKAVLARARSRFAGGPGYRARAWDLASGVRLHLDGSGLWVERSESPNH